MNNRIRMVMRTLNNGRLTLNAKVNVYYWAQEDHINLKSSSFKSSIGFNKQKGTKKGR